MRIDLSGKLALVTGASRGIGKAIAVGLVEAGAEVVLMSRDQGRLEALAAELRAGGGLVDIAPCDVSKVQEVTRVVAALPRLDILVNNAGTNLPEPFLEVSEAHFDQIINLNLRAAFFMAQTAVKKMLEADKGGVVINLTSQMGHVGASQRTVYCASKHALEGLTKALAIELAPHIRVNSVAPTFIETDLTRPMLAETQFEQSVLSKIPLGHLGQPQDVASAVVFLVSPAASMITGASLLVDGGWTAQ
ncbi:MAG: SDR family oxidoreductase [Thermaceae bacterium]|nr:SDR family oxidoreductase [Thermaceae bacterium]